MASQSNAARMRSRVMFTGVDLAGPIGMDFDYVAVQEWMWHEAGLGITNANTLMFYATVYGHSRQHRGPVIIDLSAYAESHGISYRTVKGIVKTLTDDGLINTMPTTALLEGGGQIRCYNAYACVQERVDEAFEGLFAHRQMNRDRGYDLTSEVLAEAIDMPLPSPRNQENAQETAQGKNCPTKLPAETPENGDFGGIPEEPDAYVVQKLPHEITCGNSEQNMRSKQPSTCGSSDKTAGKLFERRYIEEEEKREELGVRKNIPKDKSPKGDLQVDTGDSADEPSSRVLSSLSPSEKECLDAMIASSGKGRYVRGEHYVDTARALMSATRDPLHPIAPVDVLAAFRAYVAWYWSDANDRAAKDVRYELFPKSFLERPDGLIRWDAEVRAGGPVLTATAAPKGSSRTARRRGDAVRLPDGTWGYIDEFGALSGLGRLSATWTEQDARREIAERLGWRVSAANAPADAPCVP